MKTFFSVLIFLFLAAGTYGQDFAVAIYYLSGEKSKDSHSSEESIAISGQSVAYSIEYSGARSRNQNDMAKTCEFTEQDIKNIKQTIKSKELNVNDSLFSKDTKYKSYEVYCNLNIVISMDGQEYRIRINGDTKELDNKSLYNNAVSFITMLRKMVKDC